VTVAVVEPWVEVPLKQFVDEARVLLALLLHPSGQVLGQHGFTRAVDVMSACALAAGMFASAGELGRMLDGRPFARLHHAGRTRQMFLGQADTPRGPYIFLTVFDGGSSLGLVQLYFDEFRTHLAAATPPEVRQEPVLAHDFEADLNKNLAVLFGRAS
jgi:hypothetical protein